MKAKTIINGEEFWGNNLVGQKFNQLTLLNPVGKNRWGHVLWTSLCECGAKKTLEGKEVRRGRIKSCGCGQNKIIHGHSRRGEKSVLYQTHQDMLGRCYDKKDEAWRYYGGRGIKVCARWKSFPAFLEDMAPTWEPGLTLDREDNDGDYGPDNCRWATRLVQANNKRSNRIITIRGVSKTMSEWARHQGMSYGALELRINALGWGYEEAITTPVRKVTRRPRVV